MPSRHLTAMVLKIALALGLAASASGAGAEERCSGTLCDLYYGNSSPAEQPAGKPAAPKPLMVPSLLSGNAQTGAATPNGAAPAPTSRLQVQGGGLLGLMRGQSNERCGGTLCDLYYGGPAPEKPAAATAPVPTDAAAAPEDEAAAEPEERPSRRRGYETVEREAKPRCAATAQDPWRCYR